MDLRNDGGRILSRGGDVTPNTNATGQGEEKPLYCVGKSFSTRAWKLGPQLRKFLSNLRIHGQVETWHIRCVATNLEKKS